MSKPQDSFLDPLFKGLTKLVIITTLCICFIIFIANSEITLTKKRGGFFENMAMYKTVAKIIKK